MALGGWNPMRYGTPGQSASPPVQQPGGGFLGAPVRPTIHEPAPESGRTTEQAPGSMRVRPVMPGTPMAAGMAGATPGMNPLAQAMQKWGK